MAPSQQHQQQMQQQRDAGPPPRMQRHPSSSSPSPPHSNNYMNTYQATRSFSSTSDVPLSPLSPRKLYADSFDRPLSARSLPSNGFRKNVQEMTGFTTTEEEFDALPLAVRRKYFSTLERLRFAQISRTNALNDLPIQPYRKGSLADRRGLNIPVLEPRRKISGSRRVRKQGRQSISSNEASWFLTLPDKIKKKEFTREEQAALAGRLRESVILDAADEAIYKASRRHSRNLTPFLDPSSAYMPGRNSESSSRLDSPSTASDMSAMIYESFRWMDEEEDLDLKLVLDDYHANLDGVVLPTSGSHRRPSFRRQMSISKMPFGRNSMSSNPPLSPRSPKFDKFNNNHNRSKSRAMSLIAPRQVGHMPQASVASIDPNATHYQDPEARLKLRVYLASPQKFDEAIEFGFPSLEGVTDGDKENKPPKRLSKDMGGKRSFATEKSFLADDTSLFEDDISMADPDSPLTPMYHDSGNRIHHRDLHLNPLKSGKKSEDFSHLGIPRPTVVKQQDSYAQAMAGSREMTLRMTLTRPDLRADETQIYGWQTQKSPLRDEHCLLDIDDSYDIKGPLGGVDGWGPADKDSGVVKRFWKKVKGSQRHSSGSGSSS